MTTTACFRAVWCSICTILVFSACSCSVSASNNYSYTSHHCDCGLCFNKQQEKAEIKNGWCTTFSGEQGLYYIGPCPFRYTINNTNRMYSEPPSDLDQLNDAMCGPYNRRGLLCGRCIDGYGPTVNPLDMRCANCSKFATGYAIILYLLNEFIPITLFFICVVIFRIKLTAGPLLGYVIFCFI